MVVTLGPVIPAGFDAKVKGHLVQPFDTIGVAHQMALTVAKVD